MTNPDRIVTEHVEAQMPMPSMPNAMNIVFSRPIMSEIQPKNRTRQAVEHAIDGGRKRHSGHGHADQRDRNGVDLQSTAIGFRLAVTINPPAPTMTNMKYISQKIG